MAAFIHSFFASIHLVSVPDGNSFGFLRIAMLPVSQGTSNCVLIYSFEFCVS